MSVTTEGSIKLKENDVEEFVITDPIRLPVYGVNDKPTASSHENAIIATTDDKCWYSDGSSWKEVQIGEVSVSNLPDLDDVSDHVFQAFRIKIQNISGTLKHHIRGLNSHVDDASDLADAINNPSTTDATLTTNSFTNGVSIVGASNHILSLDCKADQDAAVCAVDAWVMRCDTGEAIDIEPSVVTRTIDSVSGSRLELICYQEKTGSVFAWNTTNIASGQIVFIGVRGYMKK